MTSTILDKDIMDAFMCVENIKWKSEYEPSEPETAMVLDLDRVRKTTGIGVSQSRKLLRRAGILSRQIRGQKNRYRINYNAFYQKFMAMVEGNVKSNELTVILFSLSQSWIMKFAPQEYMKGYGLSKLVNIAQSHSTSVGQIMESIAGFRASPGDYQVSELDAKIFG